MNKPYLIHFDYYATCEGRREAIALVIADRPSRAKIKFLKQTLLKNLTDKKHIQESIQYFSPGIGILNLKNRSTHKQARIWLSRVYKRNIVSYILHAERHCALHEFIHYLYINYS